MTVQQPIPDPDPGGPRHVMTPDQFWERFIDMCQTNDCKLTEVTAALFGAGDYVPQMVLLLEELTTGGILPHLLRRIEVLESRLESLEERS